MRTEYRRPLEADIVQMAREMRPLEQIDFASAFPTVEHGLRSCVAASDADLQAVLIDGRLAAIYGLCTGWMGLHSIANPWLALAAWVEDAPLSTTRVVVEEARKVLDRWSQRYALFANFVPAFDEPAIRLLRALHFQFLNECVTTNGVDRIPFYRVGGLC